MPFTAMRFYCSGMAHKQLDDAAEALLKRAYETDRPDEQLALYRDWAGTYDETMIDGLGYLSPSNCANLLAEHLPDRTADIIDIGCGTGLAGAALAAHGYRTIDGLDISQAMLDVAGGRGIYRNLFVADLLGRVNVDDATYGGAICTGTFTHAHVGAACLDEICRILAPGAVFAFTVHRDVLGPMGFADKLADLQAQDILHLLAHHNGKYFEDGDPQEGNYFAYRKA